VEHYTAKFELEIANWKQHCADINCHAEIKTLSRRKLNQKRRFLGRLIKKSHHRTERLQLAQRVIDNGLMKTTIMLAKQLSLLPVVQIAAQQSHKPFFLKFGFCKSLPMSKERTKYLATLAFYLNYLAALFLELIAVVRNSLEEPRHKRINNIMCSLHQRLQKSWWAIRRHQQKEIRRRHQQTDTDTESEYQPRCSKDITIERCNWLMSPIPSSPVKQIIRAVSKPTVRERNSQIFSNSPSGLVPGSRVKQIISSFRERIFSKSQGYEKSIKENTNFHKKTIHSLSLRPLVLVYLLCFHLIILLFLDHPSTGRTLHFLV